MQKRSGAGGLGVFGDEGRHAAKPFCITTTVEKVPESGTGAFGDGECKQKKQNTLRNFSSDD